MTEAKKILTMIEAVDLDDTDALDEVDARVWCLVFKKTFFKHYDDNMRFVSEVSRETVIRDGTERIIINWVKLSPPKYTRSRDALKSIRPTKHYWKGIYYGPTGWQAEYTINTAASFESPRLPTEELAELHSIIQAIEWERGNE